MRVSGRCVLTAAILLLALFSATPALGTPQTLVADANSEITRKVEFTLLWTSQVEGNGVSAPVYAGDLVYTVSGNGPA
jgi:hypothetical protein